MKKKAEKGKKNLQISSETKHKYFLFMGYHFTSILLKPKTNLLYSIKLGGITVSELSWESQDLHTFMNVMQILTTRSIHSYRLAAVHLTVTPKRNYFMRKATHVLVSFTDTQHISWSMNSIHLLYNI